MKKHCVLCFIFINIAVGLYAQRVAINTDGSVPDASAILDVKSTDKGVLIPRMTTVQRTAIVNPAKGLLVFQTDPVPAFCYYNGKVWVNLTNGYVITNTGYSSNYGFVTTFAGDTAAVSDIVNGVGTSASFGLPIGLATDTKGNLYETDLNGHSIRKITSTGIVSTFAGNWTTQGHVDATGSAARFRTPIGIVADPSGNLYVAEQIGKVIRKITPSGVVTTLAGRPGTTSSADGDSTTTASFRDLYGITRDRIGNLYVTDMDDQVIRKIDTLKRVTTIAGAFGVTGFVNSADNAGGTLFNNPSGIGIDTADNLYVTDQNNHCIRKITPAGIVTTFAGTGSPGFTNGPVATATFNLPTGIAVAPDGTVYVADRNNNAIRKISTTGVVSTLAGTGLPGYLDGSDVSASFDHPFGLTLDLQGNLYVADHLSRRIRKILLH